MNFEQMIGFGVAGNFAGYLEQAGEAADFTQVKTVSRCFLLFNNISDNLCGHLLIDLF